MIQISIVILTYNSANYIKLCLDSVYMQGYQDFEVIVVDNGSKDETVSLIKEIYPQVIMIENKDNLGASKGRNQGIEISRGKWVLTLDCDIILNNNFLAQAGKFIENMPQKVGAIQSKILKSDSGRIYSNGIHLSFLRRFLDINQGKTDNDRFNSVRDVFGACSAAALYNRSMLEEIKEQTGYFDERFFFLVEDVDLSWRARKRGWRIIFEPKLICSHYGNSSAHNKKIRQYFSFRNRFYTIQKNEGVLKYALRVIPLLCYDLPRTVYLLLTNPYMFSRIQAYEN
ncbi:MAG: glycosyltransferase family 2 protein [Candidatus Omnitrophota bacterium]